MGNIFGDLALHTAPVRADGRIFYADLQTGLIKALPMFQFGGSAILPNGLTVHGFGQDEDGELYALVTNTSANGTGGIVYKLTPIRLASTPLGNSLDITWPVVSGRLQSQTNGLGTNWSDLPNASATNHVTVPIDPKNGSVFFRLSVQDANVWSVTPVPTQGGGGGGGPPNPVKAGAGPSLWERRLFGII